MTQDQNTPTAEAAASSTPAEGTPPDGTTDPTAPRQRGRAARLQAEDAADAVRAPRWRGFSDAPASVTSDQSPAGEMPGDAADVPPATRRSVRMDILLFVLLVLATVAIAYVLYPRLAHPHRDTASVTTETPPPTNSNGQSVPGEAPVTANTALGNAVGNQATQMAALTARVATLESALGNSARLDDLNRRLTTLEGKSAEATSVLALADRVSALESASRGAIAAQTARVALVLAIAQWRDALADGRPFALELESVKALAERAVETLTGLDDARFLSHAAGGIATTAVLRERFDDTAAAVTRAAAVPGGFNGIWGRSVERLMSIITVRRVDGLVEGNTSSAILARAGAFLKDGNLAAAVTEMDQLTGNAATAAQPWLDEAHARVAAEQTVAAATSTALGALATLPNAQPSAAPVPQ